MKLSPKIRYYLALVASVQLLVPHISMAHSVNQALIMDRPQTMVARQYWPDYEKLYDDSEEVRTLQVVVTAYNSEVGQTDNSPFITASGSHVRDGIIAINVLPFGTRVRFPDLYGNKVFVVEDRMNQRYSYRADIWMEHKSDAIQFGVKYATMEVLED